ncbi:hypothetical protein T484DRAFT_2610439 [Baffinella frigidus]|nr:hypothetical protein T484DRAFT_2610439 [Cryptophyta sp. CCMP2293]
MLFLAAGRLGQLMMLRAIELLPYAARLQAAVRGVLDRARYIEMRDAASEFLRTQKARLFIQRWWRSRVAARRRASRTLPFFRDSASAPSKPKLPPLLGAFSPGGKPPPPLQKGGSVKVRATPQTRKLESRNSILGGSFSHVGRPAHPLQKWGSVKVRPNP